MKEKELTSNKSKDLMQIYKKEKLWKRICFFSMIFFVISLLFSVKYYFYPKISRIITGDTIGIELDSGNECKNCDRRYIDGVFVQNGEENVYPVAVIIDNHIDSRPPASLSKANLVYEAEAEGGITRYLAIFATRENIKKIGPVRSARPYFIDFAKELSALFVHCGGSPKALVKISKDNIFGLNEFYNDLYFWRDKNRPAPHNIFTSTELLNKYIENQNYDLGKFLSWKFKDENLQDNNGSKLDREITINFKYQNFVVKWKYDMINNEYLRYLNGIIHRDEDGGEIRVKNIVIQKSETKVIDKELRLEIKTIGQGDSIICLDGFCEQGEWRKNNPSSRTRYYYKDNNEVIFNAGKIWIEVVSPELRIEY